MAKVSSFVENFSFHNLISMQKSLGKLVLKMHHLYVAELDRRGALEWSALLWCTEHNERT